MKRHCGQATPMSPALLLAAAVVMSMGAAQGSTTQFVDHATRQLAATDRQQVAQMFASLADAARQFRGESMQSAIAQSSKAAVPLTATFTSSLDISRADVPRPLHLRDALLNLPPPRA